MARKAFPKVATPTTTGPARRRRGKPGKGSKGQTANKRKPLKTHPGHERHSANDPFRVETWHTEPKETPGRKPRVTQAKHPPKRPRKRIEPRALNLARTVKVPRGRLTTRR